MIEKTFSPYSEGENLLFVISPPRSGSTLLQRMLGSHSQVFTQPEPHLITPMAYLGYDDYVEKAPYDQINSADAIRQFVAKLPQQETDYRDALRAYANTLYGRMLGPSGKTIFMDKTPAYALVLPFLTKVFPKAKYVVLTRHPLAIFSSYANSFFEGDWQTAHNYNRVVEKYVPAITRFLREKWVPYVHVRYEDLVRDPENELKRVFEYCGLPHEPEAVNYGERFEAQQGKQKGAGDPITVANESRPTEKSLHKWAGDVASDPTKTELANAMIAALSSDELGAWGFTREEIWAPVANASASAPKRVRNNYTLQRRVMLALKKDIDKRPHGKLVRAVRYYCDVLLRESL